MNVIHSVRGCLYIAAIFCILVLLAIPPLAHAEDDPFANHIDIKAPADLKDARMLHEAVFNLHAKIEVCMEKRIAYPDECACLYKPEYEAAEAVYKDVMTKHPDWRGKVLFFKPQEDAFATNLHMQGLTSQFEHRGCAE